MKQSLNLYLLRQVAQKVLPEGAHAWLYGSRARGEAREDSDWDILILIDKPSADTSDFEKSAYPFVELGWEHNAAVSPQLYTKQEWAQRSFTPYFQNVEHDKIQIL